MSISLSSPRPQVGRRNLLAVGGLLFVAPLVLGACGSGVSASTPTEEASAETVDIVNCGRDLTFDEAPSAVVGMMPSQTELLVRLGVQDRLVGQAQTGTSPLPEDVADKVGSVPVISTDAPPSREDLLVTAPDLVVSPTEYEFTAEQGYASISQLADNGAQAYVATGGCAERRSSAEVADVLSDITNLGEILRVPDAADTLRAEAEERLDAVAAAVGDRPQPTVAQVYVEGNTLGAIGAGVEADIIRLAGGENVFDPDAPEFADFFAAEINPEEIVSRNPDAIVFGTTSPDHEERTLDYLRKTFPEVPAVVDDLLIAVPQSDLYPGTLGNIDAVESIAAQLYPDLS